MASMKPLSNEDRRLHSEMRKAMDEANRQFNASKEKYIRSELRRLKTHRMNVVLVTKGIVADQRKNAAGQVEFVMHEDCWLETLLPRGPRPLP